jgi:hypothetical protein
MVIINMPRKIVVKVVEYAIIVEEELPMRWKNMAKYCQNVSDNDESDDSNNLQGNNSLRQQQCNQG